MHGHISSCSEHIIQLVEATIAMYPRIPLRLGFVGYRDHCDGVNRLAILDFGTDVDAFKAFVRSQAAIGGGDAPEDVMGALNIAVNMDWQAATRVLFHIGDAPCHGTEYHLYGEGGDSHPRGDPHGLTPDTLLPALKQKGVMYNFGRINMSTDKMVRVFNAKMGDTGYIDTVDVPDAATMMSAVSVTVTDTMSRVLSSSVSPGDEKDKKIDISLLEFDRGEPKWPTVDKEEVIKYSLAVPGSIDLVMGALPKCFVDRAPEICKMKVAKLPFDAGALRLVHKAREEGSGALVVHKTPLVMRAKNLIRERFEKEYMSCHAAATCLARDFMRIKPPSFPGIQYVDVHLIEYLDRDGLRYCTQERMLTGPYEKFSNNTGFVMRNPSKHGTNHDVVQAFSHWTYHVTRGFLCVVDCQGVYSAAENMITLTDPALHCEDLSRYHPTNMHRLGFRRFFQTHKCNDCCRAMGLTMPTIPADEDEEDDC